MIEIRHANVKDFPHLPEIEKDAGTLFADFGLPEIAASDTSPEDFYRGLPEGSLVLVAEDNSIIVGFLVGLVVDGQAYLRELSVRRSHAKRGIGKRLAEGIIQWAAAKGFHTVTLTTFRDLPFNETFYAKLGFKEFAPDNAWSELRAIRDKEKRNGLDIRPRIAMRLDLDCIKTELQPYFP
ncbi:MAG: GNAT family N-acetyltransferase [Alphaproteobacteria bacterium]|nr:GNAT family N-acetyltransferase [Alphaproteobacteria bacterium]